VQVLADCQAEENDTFKTHQFPQNHFLSAAAFVSRLWEKVVRNAEPVLRLFKLSCHHIAL
jgi:hypothetical protein